MVAHLVWDQRAAGSNPVIPTKQLVGNMPASRKKEDHEYGSLAQLGERLPYKQDVTGSSPVTPTMIFAGVAQLAEQLICNQQVAGSSPITSSNMGEFPSGQRGQTVNLLLIASVVRIHPLPPVLNISLFERCFFDMIKYKNNIIYKDKKIRSRGRSQ